MENVRFFLNYLVIITEPSIEPTLDLDYPIYITNNSILIHWKIDPNRCKDMNGMFFKFAIELKVNHYES